MSISHYFLILRLCSHYIRDPVRIHLLTILFTCTDFRCSNPLYITGYEPGFDLFFSFRKRRVRPQTIQICWSTRLLSARSTRSLSTRILCLYKGVSSPTIQYISSSHTQRALGYEPGLLSPLNPSFTEPLRIIVQNLIAIIA